MSVNLFASFSKSCILAMSFVTADTTWPLEGVEKVTRNAGG